MHAFKKIKGFTNSKIKETGAQYTVFGAFGVFNYPIYYFVWSHLSIQPYNNLILRLIATLLCSGLLLNKYWPQKLRSFLPIYWYATLLFCLPFFFTYMLIMNNLDYMWFANTVVVIFFLILLVDWISFIILQTIGVILGIVFAYALAPYLFYYNTSVDYVGILITYFVAIVIGVIFAHNKQVLEEERLRTMSIVGSSIAHELRTPLATIGLQANSLQAYLPTLIESYSYATKNKAAIKSIHKDSLNLLRSAAENIKAETNSAFSFIDILLTNVKQFHLEPSALKPCSVSDCVTETLERYPFQPGQRDLIQYTCENDFQFMGDKELFIHVLFNLLRNALYYIAAAGKGEIVMWAESAEYENKLHVKDTGEGIKLGDIAKIFNRFFSKTPHGTGLGLSYCKTVMRGIGGDIICRSDYGNYTEFILSFPKIEMK